MGEKRREDGEMGGERRVGRLRLFLVEMLSALIAALNDNKTLRKNACVNRCARACRVGLEQDTTIGRFSESYPRGHPSLSRTHVATVSSFPPLYGINLIEPDHHVIPLVGLFFLLSE